MMNFRKTRRIFFAVAMLLSASTMMGQQKNNWTPDQLMEPAVLAKKITEGKQVPLMISVGPMALIPNSLDMGQTTEAEGLKKLRETLSALPKKENIVIYCGCCPFDRCPNVRPAIDLLKKMNFSNYHLLNLPVSIKANWIDKGYPTVE